MCSALLSRRLCLALVSGVLAAGAGCGSGGPRDVGSTYPRSAVVEVTTARVGETQTSPPPGPLSAGRKPQTFATVDGRALALGTDRVFFGNAEDDSLLSLPKQRANDLPTLVASHAPMKGALSFDARTSTLAWIPSSGDAVLRVDPNGGRVATIRDRGIFADVIASEGDVFITEAQGASGVLTRVTGATAARLASFEGTPRGLAVDATSAYVATSSRLVAATRARGEVIELARGMGFAAPQVDDTSVYAVAIQSGSAFAEPPPTYVDSVQRSWTPSTSVLDGATRQRVIVRARKTGGGALETVVRNVRDASIRVKGSTLYWFDENRPALFSIVLTDPAARPVLVSEDPLFENVEALAVDDERAYAAVGTGGTGRIVVIDLH